MHLTATASHAPVSNNTPPTIIRFLRQAAGTGVVSPHFIYNFLLYSMNHKLVSSVEMIVRLQTETSYPIQFDNLLFVNGRIILKWMILKIQPDITVCRYLFTANSLYMFRVSQHPSSGVLKTVTATSGTATSLACRPRWREVAVPVL